MLNYLFLESQAFPMAHVLKSRAFEEIAACTDLVKLSVTLSAMFEQIVQNEDLSYPVRPFNEMDDVREMEQNLPSSKVPLACSILNAMTLILISHHTLPHSAAFDTQRCALFTIPFCIQVLHVCLVHYEARLTLSSSAKMPQLLQPLLTHIANMLSLALLVKPTVILMQSLLSTCPRTYTASSPAYDLASIIDDFVGGDGVLAVHRVVSVILLPQIAMYINHLKSEISDQLTFTQKHTGALASCLSSAFSIFLLSFMFVSSKQKSALKVGKYVDRFESAGEPSLKPSRPFVPQFEEMNIERTEKTGEVSSALSRSRFSTLRSATPSTETSTLRQSQTMRTDSKDSPVSEKQMVLGLFAQVVVQAMGLILPAVTSRFADSARRLTFQPSSKMGALPLSFSMALAMEVCPHRQMSTEKVESTQNPFLMTLLHYCLSALTSLFTETFYSSKSRQGADRSSVDVESADTPLSSSSSQLYVAVLEQKTIVPCLLFLALYCPAYLPLPDLHPVPVIAGCPYPLSRTTERTLQHLTQLYSSPSSSVITLAAMKLLAYVQKCNRNAMERAFGHLHFEPELVNHPTMPPAAQPSLPISLAEQLRSSPSLFYAWRAGLDETAITRFRIERGEVPITADRLTPQQERSKYFRQKKLEGGVIQRQTGPTAQVTLKTASTNTGSNHLLKYAEWRRKQKGDEPPPQFKQDKTREEYVQSLLAPTEKDLTEEQAVAERAKLILINAGMFEELERQQTENSLLYSGNEDWPEVDQVGQFVNLNTAIVFGAEKSKELRNSYSFLERGKEKQKKGKKDEKKTGEMGDVERYDGSVKEGIEVEMVKLREWELVGMERSWWTESRKGKKKKKGKKRSESDGKRDEAPTPLDTLPSTPPIALSPSPPASPPPADPTRSEVEREQTEWEEMENEQNGYSHAEHTDRQQSLEASGVEQYNSQQLTRRDEQNEDDLDEPPPIPSDDEDDALPPPPPPTADTTGSTTADPTDDTTADTTADTTDYTTDGPRWDVRLQATPLAGEAPVRAELPIGGTVAELVGVYDPNAVLHNNPPSAPPADPSNDPFNDPSLPDPSFLLPLPTTPLLASRLRIRLFMGMVSDHIALVG
ncbi:hypothetical protein BLNAU_14492 [Blattamonas nauphoetae]|uniref:Uncharacterized protein n=1 Tax=Blattamonas nauphoetae TaxID=2049346 RepID=A0ABQ9XGQ0_9EUKA|nr:hypothetical protein BLNAU_14492 [Blattamonas nauphoetae]